MIRSTANDKAPPYHSSLPCLMKSLKNGAIYFMYFRNDDGTLRGVCVKESKVTGIGHDLTSADASQFEIYTGFVKLENV